MKNFTLTLLCLLTFSGMLMAQWESSDLGTGTKLKKLYALDDQNAIIIGLDTTIIKTTDGGNVWETMNFTLPNIIDYDFSAIDFAMFVILLCAFVLQFSFMVLKVPSR